MNPLFVIVVLTLADTVEDVIGPFWDERSAEAFADRNLGRMSGRVVVRQITERGVWLAGIERGSQQ